MTKARLMLLVAGLAAFAIPGGVAARPEQGLKALIVTAHPDGETMFAAAVYRPTQGLGATASRVLFKEKGSSYALTIPYFE